MISGGFMTKISNTFKMMKSCLVVLRKDRELIFFPIFAAISILILLAVYNSLGLIPTEESEVSAAPILILLFVANFFIVLFNSALVSAALERLRGGDPNVRSGLVHAIKHIHHIVIWSIIVTIVAILIAIIRGDRRERSIMRELFASFLQAGWTMMTFFVVPIIVSENLTWAEFSRINLFLHELQGAEPLVSVARVYPHNSTSHIVGYVSQASVKDLQRKEYLRDMSVTGIAVGKTGLESKLDKNITRPFFF